MSKKGTKVELLKHLMELFPVIGHVEGQQELKMKTVMKYGGEPKEVVDKTLQNLDELIEDLKEQGVLNEFEFNGTINYKAKKDIPINLGASSGSASGGGVASDQLNALADLVMALAETSEDGNVQSLLLSYKEKYT